MHIHFSGEPQSQESVQIATGGSLRRLLVKAREHRGAGDSNELGVIMSGATTCCQDK